MSDRKERIAEHILKLAAEFLESISDRTSMITVTGVNLSSDLSAATILVTVYPTSKETVAIAFAKRHAGDFRDFVKKTAKMQRLPYFDFAIDHGEKNRQRIDELSQSQ